MIQQWSTDSITIAIVSPRCVYFLFFFTLFVRFSFSLFSFSSIYLLFGCSSRAVDVDAIITLMLCSLLSFFLCFSFPFFDRQSTLSLNWVAPYCTLKKLKHLVDSWKFMLFHPSSANSKKKMLIKVLMLHAHTNTHIARCWSDHSKKMK